MTIPPAKTLGNRVWTSPVMAAFAIFFEAREFQTAAMAGQLDRLH